MILHQEVEVVSGVEVVSEAVLGAEEASEVAWMVVSGAEVDSGEDSEAVEVAVLVDLMVRMSNIIFYT